MTTLNPDELSVLGFLREEGPHNLENLAKISYCEASEIKLVLDNLIKYKLVDFKEGYYKCPDFSKKRK